MIGGEQRISYESNHDVADAISYAGTFLSRLVSFSIHHRKDDLIDPIRPEMQSEFSKICHYFHLTGRGIKVGNGNFHLL